MSDAPSYNAALLELADHADGVDQCMAVAFTPTDRPVMSVVGELRHWTHGRQPDAIVPPSDDMAGSYDVGGARVDLDRDGVERVERLSDGLCFHFRGGGSVALRWPTASTR